jgi:dihydrofolate reductase
MRPLALIVAWAHRQVIGHEGKLPWHEAEDMQHFKATTMEHTLIMGRKTFESIGRPLPGRRNIVISRNPDYEANGCEVYSSLEQAIEAAHETDGCPFVIGGAGVYAEALPLATRLYITIIDRDIPGDTYFPRFDASEWEETQRWRSESGELLFRILDRRRALP